MTAGALAGGSGLSNGGVAGALAGVSSSSQPARFSQSLILRGADTRFVNALSGSALFPVINALLSLPLTSR